MEVVEPEQGGAAAAVVVVAGQGVGEAEEVAVVATATVEVAGRRRRAGAAGETVAGAGEVDPNQDECAFTKYSERGSRSDKSTATAMG